ncbi:MAG: thioredoxin domain-containing protein [Parcubacteria group bacterium]|nr:thioredoxin domain-containing protein [Parcubacteria group bacterium]
MIDKKTIILGLVIIAVLVGVVWYNNQNGPIIDNQTASIVEIDSESEEVTELDGDFIIGDPNAPVTMIEYSSYQCGACSNFHELTFPLIIENYVKTGKVKVITRLVSHPALSVAVLCGQEQGAFWEVNEYIFGNIATIQTIDDIQAVAGILGLNQESFNQCFNPVDEYVGHVLKWFEQGEKPKDCDRDWLPSCQIIEWFHKFEEDGLQDTPSFLINNQQIIGNRLYSQFERIIEEELAK